MNFGDLIGQQEVINSLKNSISNKRVSHAYVFEGPEGIGKKTVASIFAAALTCKQQDGEPCNSCKSCIQNRSGNHPDVKWIETAGKSIGIEDIRAMQSEVYIKPYSSDRKIFIINEADKMTVQAQNALLKILEEPPAYIVIILLAANSAMLLSTILSRTMSVKFRFHPQSEIEGYLRNCYPEVKQDIPFISMFSGGIIGKAKEMAESQEYREMRYKLIEIMEVWINENEQIILDTMDFFKEQKNKINSILDFMVLWIRDVLFIKELTMNNYIINIDMKNKLEQFAQKASSYALCRIMDVVIDTKKKINMNVNFNLAIETMLLRCWEEVHGRYSRCAI